MSKIYITKAKLEEIISQYTKETSDYPKPILNLLVATLAIILLAVAISLLLLFVLVRILYALVSWIDTIIGKHIIKGIFKK